MREDACPLDYREARVDRTIVHLERAIDPLPVVIVFDNSEASHPFRLEAVYRDGARLGP